MISPALLFTRSGARPNARNAKAAAIKLCFLLLLYYLQVPISALAQTAAPVLVAYAGQNETVGPMWVGIEKGTFKRYGLDVRLVQMRNGALSMATLSTGQVQYNYGSPGNALSA
ncbi:MAG TPA: hypothetical protein VLH17_11825, partial [Candidatus Binatia bacterium]|nr:hypothetical protein [Candidatus Binatia bacterium]